MKSNNSPWEPRVRPPPSARLILRRLLNARDLAIWARKEDFADLRPSAWHLSVALVEERATMVALDDNAAVVAPFGDRHLVRMGELIALAFDAPELLRRHHHLRRIGCFWDFPVYRPHVSFTVDGRQRRREARPFEGALIFGPEVID